MKIGIITLYILKDNNYGQALQTYALQKYLHDNGHEPFLIRYDEKNKSNKKPSPLYKKLLKALNPVILTKFLFNKIFDRHKLLEREVKRHNRHFEDFYERYINSTQEVFTSYDDLKKNPPIADCYITGSDQVWNFKWDKGYDVIKNKLNAYFLNFGDDKIKRISYAASFSNTTTPPCDIIPIIKTLLEKFDFIGVREESGIDICKICGIENAQITLDPTMLLDATNYRTLYKNIKLTPQNKPYLFLYLLKNECNFNIKSIYKFARRKQLHVVFVTGNGLLTHYKKTFPTIEEWLYLIDNAQYVVTNSYHASVFSLIFNKKFGVIPLTGEKSDMNTRLTTLFTQWGCGERWINNNSLYNMDRETNVKKPSVVFPSILK